MARRYRRKNSPLEFLKLFRIEHSIMLIIAVIAGEVIALGRIPSALTMILSIIPPILIGAASFAINDYFDIQTDRKNLRYDRPLVSDTVSKDAALASSAVLFVVGVLFAILSGTAAFLIALVFAVLAFLYSLKLKETFALGNAYIALSMVIPFIYGNYVVSGVFSPTIGLVCIVIFFAGFAREVHGMIRDYRGDTVVRAIRNVVYYVGMDGAATVAGLMYALAIAVSVYIFFLPGVFYLNLIYLAPILFVDLVLVYVVVGHCTRLYKRDKWFFKTARNATLGVMTLAIITYLMAALVYIRI